MEEKSVCLKATRHFMGLLVISVSQQFSVTYLTRIWKGFWGMKYWSYWIKIRFLKYFGPDSFSNINTLNKCILLLKKHLNRFPLDQNLKLRCWFCGKLYDAMPGIWNWQNVRNHSSDRFPTNSNRSSHIFFRTIYSCHTLNQ